ncbi:toxin-antitoxin system YwqK family antitoxin [Winogradskyella forsetii]|uniref:toxin-antitoxin system YwqK family antitoxin n=1 Tax=Winogradskyella forsetii TaxID=2686077 RepID=UPI0015BCD8EF|nr:hypothetical protein [Winogradskyella forsetii]
MKIKYLIIIALFFSCGANKSTIHQKKIQSTTFKEDFSVTTEEFNPSSNITYYWYKSNEILQSKGEYSGELLHGTYTRYYITNQLEEKGEFNYGLKTKQWRSWFANGQLQSIRNYSNGKLNGVYQLYDDTGLLIISGKYKSNKKTGRWINHVTKDTLHYRRDIIKIEDSLKTNKPSFFKRIFKKKDKDNKDKIKPKKSKPQNKVNKNSKPKKDSFFKRLFSKKDKKNVKS